MYLCPSGVMVQTRRVHGITRGKHLPPRLLHVFLGIFEKATLLGGETSTRKGEVTPEEVHAHGWIFLYL